ncbi:YnfC family lipoprotein [Enterobacter cloacae subsp. cloacae]|nr:YnfC family lipoprotein [Enterobacter cloacae subsp. cloacae]
MKKIRSDNATGRDTGGCDNNSAPLSFTPEMASFRLSLILTRCAWPVKDFTQTLFNDKASLQTGDRDDVDRRCFDTQAARS